MKNKEIKTKRKSLLPLLLTILIMLLAFVACAVAIGTSGNDDNSETVEVSAVIPKKKNAEISGTTEKTTIEKTTTTSKTTQTTEKTTATTKITTTTESFELEFTQLYLDFFAPYEKSFGKLTLEEFQQNYNEKMTGYNVQITEGNENSLWSFNISDSNGNSVYIAFYPNNDMYENPPESWSWTLSTLSYNSNGNEISISDRFHINNKLTYTIYNKNAEPPSKEVTNVNELKEFMF